MTFDTKFDLVRRLDGEWSILLVAMGPPAKISNMVNGSYEMLVLLQILQVSGLNVDKHTYQIGVLLSL